MHDYLGKKSTRTQSQESTNMDKSEGSHSVRSDIDMLVLELDAPEESASGSDTDASNSAAVSAPLAPMRADVEDREELWLSM